MRPLPKHVRRKRDVKNQLLPLKNRLSPSKLAKRKEKILLRAGRENEL